MLQSELTCIVYHHVSNKPDPFVRHLDITTTPENLKIHLDHFQRHYTMIDIDQVLSGNLPPNPLLITFDDSFKSTLEIAAPILKRKSIPGVAFLNPAMVTEKKICLDNLLSYFVSQKTAAALAELIPDAQDVPTSAAAFIAQHVAHMSVHERETLKQHVLDVLNCKESKLWEKSGLYLNPSDIKKFRSFDMEIGNHTTNHIHCRNLKNTELAKEITGSKSTLEDLAQRPVRTFAFPYGNKRDATREVLNTIRETGHDMIFLVHARSNMKRPAPDLWYRVSLTNEPKYWLGPKLRLLPKVRSLVHGAS